ncbi:unnamed protein product [Blepharisma stoltei]|uniref:DNA alkylation repair enzyme n=1 Tax=Blepharisma stoltei TaxID=1481888 RepID=A0AAU9IV14_9CILI|nr:unnamed protein product [Blepharisma stoltei]
MSLNVLKSSLETALEAARSIKDAERIGIYIKNLYPYLGLWSPQRKSLQKSFIEETKNLNQRQIFELVDWLWGKEYREYQYIATDMLIENLEKLEIENVDYLLNVVHIKPYWDSVDYMTLVINKIIKKSLSLDPDAQKIMDNSIIHSNLWVRRVAITHQLGWKQLTDTKRLFGYITSQAHDKDFFIRKAIGWALRDFAKFNHEEVYKFVDENKSILSGLSYREATKHRLKYSNKT